MGSKVRKPVCIGCPHDLHFRDSISKRQYGVMLHPGGHYCTGGKKARRFKRGDMKNGVPEWCPRRKSPCELRLYGFRDKKYERLYCALSCDRGKAISPSGHRYALRRELHTELLPSEFWPRCNVEPDSDLLGFEVNLYEVLEIDDGLRPVFFYKTDKGFVVIPIFDAEAARKEVPHAKADGA